MLGLSDTFGYTYYYFFLWLKVFAAFCMHKRFFKLEAQTNSQKASSMFHNREAQQCHGIASFHASNQFIKFRHLIVTMNARKSRSESYSLTQYNDFCLIKQFSHFLLKNY